MRMRKNFSAPRATALASLAVAFLAVDGRAPGLAQLESSRDAAPEVTDSEMPTPLRGSGDPLPYTMAPVRSEGDPLAYTMAPVRSDGDSPASSMAPVRSEGDPLTAPGEQPPTIVAVGGPALSTADHRLFLDAHNAADRNDWVSALRFSAQGNDPLAKLTVQWRYLLDETSGASFAAISTFLYQHPNWPRRDQMLARAEKAMPADLPPAQIVTWYGSRTPVSTDGALRLAAALTASGHNDAGAALIRKLWVGAALTPTQEANICAAYGSMLTLDDHRARLERILSTEGIGKATRLMQYVDAGTQALARARLDFKTKPAQALAATSSLSPAVANDPRYIFEMARALRRAGGRDEEAWTAMIRIGSGTVDATRTWPERHIMARDALKARRDDIAYQLVSQHGLTAGGSLADAEFLSGWIALRRLSKADIALQHFQRMAGAVSLPISRARAQYWVGRSQEALGRHADAVAAYRKAATDPGTYYGQLALARVDIAPTINLTNTFADIAAVKPAFDNDERVRAMRIFADLGQPTLLRIFAISIANETETPGYFMLLADFMAAAGDRAAALRIAKVASYKNVVLVPHFVPLVEMPKVANTTVEPALVLGLTRQESEFDPGATSTAGARGLMQLMPGTARATARQIGVTYNANRLGEPQYNMRLGIAHLDDLLNDWGGSYILVIASYNAGSGSVRNWINIFGDPRDGVLDPIDWVELIPFAETRNYVQRVLENTNVYRNRLSGREAQLQIVADLYRPNAPSAVIVRNELQNTP